MYFMHIVLLSLTTMGQTTYNFAFCFFCGIHHTDTASCEDNWHYIYDTVFFAYVFKATLHK